ncbi:zinc finger BED domain-containing protein DAYSLEEPER-like [Dorcoceras hygrometricum]|uniref:Zinc finger BED domain-containing protein DAYSLEEPER-like n=1 Tax=Dorcoceras hygrometricum TaxID=472368 RepID=A0A2Z7AXH0_9LAMI|nr:zinc finger BED domain-containing protein DAYSLEEPER-like [Dorcoceras hygrometricum]
MATGAWLQPESQGDWLFRVGGGRFVQSSPRPKARFLRQPALEGLTRSSWTETPRNGDRKKSDQRAAATGGGVWPASGGRRGGGFEGIRQPALEGLTRSSWTETPRNGDRKKSDQRAAAPGGGVWPASGGRRGGGHYQRYLGDHGAMLLDALTMIRWPHAAPPPLAAAAARRKIVSDQIDEENPSAQILSSLLVQADEGIPSSVVDLIDDIYRRLPGCAIDGRCVRSFRASQLDVGHRLRALVVRRCAARGVTLDVSSARWCCDVAPLLALAGRRLRRAGCATMRDRRATLRAAVRLAWRDVARGCRAILRVAPPPAGRRYGDAPAMS